jgi:hypothetical protein
MADDYDVEQAAKVDDSDDSDEEHETVRCSQCKKMYYITDFHTSRLGKRYKTCSECCAKRVREYVPKPIDGEAAQLKKTTYIICEAKKHGFKLIDPADYKSAKVQAMWECLSCGNHITRQWISIRTFDTCNGPHHCRTTHAKLVADTRKEFLASIGMA